jgi:hypothetical protein
MCRLCRHLAETSTAMCQQLIIRLFNDRYKPIPRKRGIVTVKNENFLKDEGWSGTYYVLQSLLWKHLLEYSINLNKEESTMTNTNAVGLRKWKDSSLRIKYSLFVTIPWLLRYYYAHRNLLWAGLFQATFIPDIPVRNLSNSLSHLSLWMQQKSSTKKVL